MRGTDTLPLSRVEAVLHQVSLGGGTPVDSATTDGAGRYRLRALSPDTASVFFVSASHHGIAYLTPPMRASSSVDEAVGTLVVYDTSSSSPSISLEQRHLVFRTDEETGARQVLELLVLSNKGSLTRIASGDTTPVWLGAIPGAAVQLQPGESDVSAETVMRRGDSVAVLAPLPPGEKQILLTYLIPADRRELSIPIDPSVGRLNIMIEDASGTVVGGSVQELGAERFEDLSFRRFEGFAVPAGAPVVVRFGVRSWGARNLWWVVVVLFGFGLAWSLAVWWRRSQRPVPAFGDAETLAARIAALDVAHEGRDHDSYRSQRAELKRRLAEAIASLNRAL